MSPVSDSSEYHSFESDDFQDGENESSNNSYKDSEVSALNQSVFDLSLLDDEFPYGDD